MTEIEVIEALSEISINAVTYMTVFLSVTFAYLTVAYFVGAQLSRFQCVAISVLYGAIGAMTGSATIGWSVAWQILRSRESSLFDAVWIFKYTDWIVVLTPFLVGVILTSFYFMFDIRRRSPNGSP